MANSEAEVKELFTAIRALGGEVYSCKSKAGKTITYTIPMKEGCMIKDPEAAYDFKRSTAVLKMKQFYTADLRISNAYSGKPGTKYVGVLGGLVLLSDCGSFSTDCGSGFDDEMRWELWNLHKKNALVGKIVEVSYQEITADGSLRFPVFIRIRDDKSTTNVEAA
jgi:DNA ligase-1